MTTLGIVGVIVSVEVLAVDRFNPRNFQSFPVDICSPVVSRVYVNFDNPNDHHQAAQRDPDSIYRENVQVELPKPEPVNTMVALGPEFYSLPLEKQNEIRTQITDAYIEERRARRNMPNYAVRDVTWGEQAEMMKECILGELETPDIGWEGISEEQAIAI